jgi:excisionase family DNA binding protein
MTIKDVADYLKLNYMTVYKLAQKGQIPAFKIGGAWRFKKDILDDWILKKSNQVR